MTIPESWHGSRRYWENLTSYVLVRRMIATKEQLFFVEPASDGWFYPCTIDDIVTVFEQCEPADIESFDFIVMRQPTRKQRILCSVWGRALFTVDIGKHQGSAIVIEAQSLGDYSWDKSITPDQARELERLKNDGHGVSPGRRKIEISPSAVSIRNTVLFRTMLHELGHHVDYRRTGFDNWDGKTSIEKEDYAHRYAEHLRQTLVSKGIIPFESMVDAAALERDGLRVEWFVAESAR